MIIGGCALLAALACMIWFVYRPWAMNWGATDDEIRRSMPGDEIIADPTFNATRAITINARPEEIWPWLLQMGYLRAGFYSYDKLDNDGVPSAERIIPEFQNLAVGDSIPLNSHVSARVVSLDPNRSMLWIIDSDEPWTWAWGIYALNPEQTRLVTRLRVRFDGIVDRMMADLGEIIMMRKCLLGIRRRAENVER
jgi:hypothetical protein